MRLPLAALTAASLALFSAAVSVDLFVMNTTCEVDNGGHFICTDIPPLTCCRQESSSFQSAKCLGLGITDVCSFGGVPRLNQHPPTGTCGPICNTGSGTPAPCVNTGVCSAGAGAYWIRVPPQLSVDEVPTECEQTVEPDLVVFGNGQSFRINHDVPAEVTAQLIELVKSDPTLIEGAPEELAPFQVKA